MTDLAEISDFLKNVIAVLDCHSCGYKKTLITEPDTPIVYCPSCGSGKFYRHSNDDWPMDRSCDD